MSLKQAFLWLAFLATLHHCRGQNETEAAVDDKRGRVFSLFSIVAFKNTGCRSSSVMTLGQSSARNGTCFTASECSAKGGVASGNCAAGFGVCCIFLISATGTTIDQNCTYLRNPDFPNTLTTNTQLSYTVRKTTPDVCFLRLDFEQFNINPPIVSDIGVLGGTFSCDTDVFVVTAPASGQLIPKICGLNAQQHIYISLGNGVADSATMAFTFTGTSDARIWEIKVSQIECNNLNRPPDGCLQYWTTVTGRITTFNFLQPNVALQGHLHNQDVSVCIRRELGYCCIMYSVCTDVIDGFTLDTSARTTFVPPVVFSEVDTLCSNDYVVIPSASVTCGGTVLNNKFCSNMLDPLFMNTVNANGMAINVPVCSCIPPFRVDFHTDNVGDLTMPPPFETTTAVTSRGVCLDYNQVPC